MSAAEPIPESTYEERARQLAAAVVAARRQLADLRNERAFLDGRIAHLATGRQGSVGPRVLAGLVAMPLFLAASIALMALLTKLLVN